ncbi:hypothetical protein FQN60_018471, partial [Etheostoma spectabile]
MENPVGTHKKSPTVVSCNHKKLNREALPFICRSPHGSSNTAQYITERFCETGRPWPYQLIILPRRNGMRELLIYDTTSAFNMTLLRIFELYILTFRVCVCKQNTYRSLQGLPKWVCYNDTAAEIPMSNNAVPDENCTMAQ